MRIDVPGSALGLTRVVLYMCSWVGSRVDPVGVHVCFWAGSRADPDESYPSGSALGLTRSIYTYLCYWVGTRADPDESGLALGLTRSARPMHLV